MIFLTVLFELLKSLEWLLWQVNSKTVTVKNIIPEVVFTWPITGTNAVKLLSGEFLKTLLVGSQRWLKEWLCAGRKESVNLANVSPGPVFCLLLRVSLNYAQPATGHVTEITYVRLHRELVIDPGWHIRLCPHLIFIVIYTMKHLI